VNVLVRGGAELVGLVQSLATTVWVSRVVGPTSFGYYAVTVTLVSLGSFVVNAGLSAAGSQRVANEPHLAGEVQWAVAITRSAVAIAVVLSVLLLTLLLPLDPVLRDYLRVGVLIWIVAPFRMEWVLVAQAMLRSISAIRVIASAASTVLAFSLIRAASDAPLLMLVPVTAATVAAVLSGVQAWRQSPFRRPDGASLAATLRSNLAQGFHYLKSDLSTFVFTSSDRLFLYVFASPTVVGLYEAAYRVIQPFYLISAVVNDSMYLEVAKSFGTDRLHGTLRRYLDLMCFATIPLGFFLIAFAPGVIGILYGTQYAQSSSYLAILGWVITFGYMSGAAVMPFSAWNLPREYGNSTGFGGAVNLALNLATIPPFGAIGAAWSTVAAKVAVTAVAINYFRRATSYPILRDFSEYVLISFAALAIAGIIGQVVSLGDLIGPGVFGFAYVVLVGLVRGRDPAWRTRVIG
jgi:O-antigen/teichoic acid export membrane protein